MIWDVLWHGIASGAVSIEDPGRGLISDRADDLDDVVGSRRHRPPTTTSAEGRIHLVRRRHCLVLHHQLDVVMRGGATGVVGIKAAITYLVPSAVSNAGVLIASRDEGQDGR